MKQKLILKHYNMRNGIDLSDSYQLICFGYLSNFTNIYNLHNNVLCKEKGDNVE